MEWCSLAPVLRWGVDTGGPRHSGPVFSPATYYTWCGAGAGLICIKGVVAARWPACSAVWMAVDKLWLSWGSDQIFVRNISFLLWYFISWACLGGVGWGGVGCCSAVDRGGMLWGRVVPLGVWIREEGQLLGIMVGRINEE